MKIIASSLVVLAVLISAGCNKSSIVKENYHFQKNGIYLLRRL